MIILNLLPVMVLSADFAALEEQKVTNLKPQDSSDFYS